MFSIGQCKIQLGFTEHHTNLPNTYKIILTRNYVLKPQFK